MQCFFANPKIYIFPRKKSLIFPAISKFEVDTTPLTINDILASYENSKNFDFAINNVGFKNIEDTIYIDLAEEIDDNRLRLTRCISIGILKKRNDNYYYNNNFKDNLDVEVACEISDSHYTCYLENISHHGHKITNKSNPSEPLIIHPGYDGNTSLDDIYIIIEIDKKHIKSSKLKIKARHKGESKWKNTVEFNIYRNTQKNLDDFKQTSSNKDSDFFVLPRVEPTANQKKCIRQLQVINNQVFARNASLSDFEFVEESGEIVNTIANNDGSTATIKTDKKMESNARKSLDAFKYDSETNAGCKSGNKIGKLETHYSYNFSNFGQQKDLIDYLSDEYFISADILKGRVYDRNFLFGNYKDGDFDNKIEGIVNLYRKVVVPFIENLTEQINLFHDFNHAWLSCPKYNKNYKRGPFTITNGMNKFIYNSNNNAINLSDIGYNSTQGNNLLPVGTIVTFKSGKDEYAFALTGENYYQIESVTIQGTRYPSFGEFSNYSIKLSLDDKKSCDDIQEDSNKGNYNNTSYDYENYGIPYYMNGMDAENNDKCTKLTKNKLLNWNESENNWYSYKKKPNTGSFGIDCSGLIINSITGIDSSKNHYFTVPDLDIDAFTIGNSYCRKLPITNNDRNYSFLTKNDIVFSRKHIAFCFDGIIKENFNNEYILTTQLSYANRQFNICHNYGMQHITIETGQQNGNLYSMKTICGQFRHWNAEIQDATITNSTSVLKTNIVRIYLWKN